MLMKISRVAKYPFPESGDFTVKSKSVPVVLFAGLVCLDQSRFPGQRHAYTVGENGKNVELYVGMP